MFIDDDPNQIYLKRKSLGLIFNTFYAKRSQFRLESFVKSLCQIQGLKTSFRDKSISYD